MHDKIASIHSVIANKLRVGREHLRDDFTLDELGLDSLTSAEVVLGVEKLYGLRIDFEVAAESFTRDTRLDEFVALIASMVERAECRV